MKTEYQYLLHLLGAYLREDEPEACPDADWAKLLELAGIHSVVGILGYLTMRYPICPDAQISATLRNFCKSTVAVFTRRGLLAQLLVQQLEEAGIDHILMKGSVLKELYPVPELRTFNDIDLVIRPCDRKKCDERMLSLGYQRKDDWEPVFSYVQGDLLVEIHTDIMEIDVSDKADYRGYFQKMWENTLEDHPHSYRFTPEFHFLYLLTHIAKHVHGSGAGARMYLDIAAFIRHYGENLDWEWIHNQLVQLNLDTFAGVVFTAVENWFGISCPMAYTAVSQAVLEHFTAYTMEAGIFGHQNRDAALAKLKHSDPGVSGNKARQFLKEAFPSAKTIQSRYTYLQDKPWLLPAAWVHRLIKNRQKLGSHARNMQGILRADDTQIQTLQQLMENIGL